MAYAQGGVIEAVDFNSFRTSVLNVFGVGNGDSGYNQAPPAGLSTSVSAGVDVVGSSEWTDLINATQTCADHQGTATTLLPPTTDVQTGDVITAHDGVTDPDDLGQVITDITSNRLVADPTSMTTTVVATETSTNTWSVQAVAEYQFTWPTEDDTRAFFNSGGELRVSGSRTGGTSSFQNTTWTDFLSAGPGGIGQIIMDYTQTTVTGGTGSGSAIGYYDLTGTYQTVASATVGSGSYAANTITVEARRGLFGGVNAANGRRVEIRMTLSDAFSGGPPDSVDGSLEIEFETYRATTHLTIQAPTVVALTAFGAGNPS